MENLNFLDIQRTQRRKTFGYIGLLLGLLFSLGFSQTDETVYAGLIDPFYAMHFMVSTDGGATWVEKATPLGGMEIHAITPDSVTPKKVYIAQGGAIYVSTDYGTTWSDNIFPYNVSWVHDVEIDPLHPEWLWATTDVRSFSNFHDTVGVFLSEDSGNTWEFAGEGIPYINGSAIQVNCIAIGTGSPRVGYVGTWAIGDTTIGVYKRDISDPSARWQYIGLRGEGPVYDIEVDPLDQNLCFVLTGCGCGHIAPAGAIWRTTDGGNSWEIVLDALQTGGTIDWDFEYRDGVLYVPVFGKGMYISYDKGNTWECYSTGLNLAVSCVSVSPNNPGVVYAGCQPSTNDPFYKSTDGGHTWFQSGYTSQLLWCVLIQCGYSEVSVEESKKWLRKRIAFITSPNLCQTFAEFLDQIEKQGLFTVEFYDLSGRKIPDVFKVKNGVYFCNFSARDYKMTRKILFLK